MKLTTAEAVKTWLRGLPLMKKELEMRIDFYVSLMRDFERLPHAAGQKNAKYYRNRIEKSQEAMKQFNRDVDRLFARLDPEERAVLTARYIRRLMWDAMEFHVHYSRRQAIRIHNRALKKLAGAEVGGLDHAGE